MFCFSMARNLWEGEAAGAGELSAWKGKGSVLRSKAVAKQLHAAILGC